MLALLALLRRWAATALHVSVAASVHEPIGITFSAVIGITIAAITSCLASTSSARTQQPD